MRHFARQILHESPAWRQIVAEATIDVTRNGSRQRSILDGTTHRGVRARWQHVANVSNVRWPSTWSRRGPTFAWQPRPDALPRRWWQKTHAVGAGAGPATVVTPLRVVCANPRRVAKVQQQMRREISNMLQTDKV